MQSEIPFVSDHNDFILFSSCGGDYFTLTEHIRNEVHRLDIAGERNGIKA